MICKELKDHISRFGIHRRKESKFQMTMIIKGGVFTFGGIKLSMMRSFNFIFRQLQTSCYLPSNASLPENPVIGWMDLLVGTGVSTALENVQWPKPFLTPAKPLRSGWLFQRIDSSTATTTGATLQYLQYFNSRSRQTAVGPGVRGGCRKVHTKKMVSEKKL